MLMENLCRNAVRQLAVQFVLLERIPKTLMMTGRHGDAPNAHQGTAKENLTRHHVSPVAKGLRPPTQGARSASSVAWVSIRTV